MLEPVLELGQQRPKRIVINVGQNPALDPDAEHFVDADRLATAIQRLKFGVIQSGVMENAEQFARVA